VEAESCGPRQLRLRDKWATILACIAFFRKDLSRLCFGLAARKLALPILSLVGVPFRRWQAIDVRHTSRNVSARKPNNATVEVISSPAGKHPASPI